MSKKDEAFELFSQGKRPSSPEVKALGLSAKTRYNYYQEWKRSNGQVLDSVELHEISELKVEKARLTLLAQIEDLEAKREKLSNRVTTLERQFVSLTDWLKVQNRLLTRWQCSINGEMNCVKWALPEGEVKIEIDNELQKAEDIYERQNRELDQIRGGLIWQ